MAAARHSFPDFDELPSVEGQPQGCLWGFFGEKDQLGTLNLLTPEVVKQASRDIAHGVHVQLDWCMSYLDQPGFGRIPLKQNIKDLGEHGFVGFDDELHFNTQTSSQWDSLKHFGIQRQGLFYNGLTVQEARETDRNGIHKLIWLSDMCERGGIAGRGVLVDWLSWWEQQNPGQEPPSAISTYKIPVSDVEQVLKHQGTVLRQGDILIMRTGFVRWHDNADVTTRQLGTRDQHHMIGLANTMDTVRWLYSKHFAAVAGDTMGFEAWPYPSDCCLHEWLLCQWGTPIGELWNLEGLSAACARLKKWDFFFTSAPLNVRGGIAYPPCAIAIL